MASIKSSINVSFAILLSLFILVSLISCRDSDINNLVLGLKEIDNDNSENAKICFQKLIDNNVKILSDISYVRYQRIKKNNSDDLSIYEKIQDAVDTRYYGKASILFDSYVMNLSSKDYVQNLATLSPDLLSLGGKACLYGKNDYDLLATTWQEASEIAMKNNQENVFMLLFYTARFYSKLDISYRDLALNIFYTSFDYVLTDENFDSSLYYYLLLTEKNSLGAVVKAIQQLYSKAKNHQWYGDFFDNLSQKLLANEEYVLYYNVYIALKTSYDEYNLPKYAYVCGRLLEEDFLPSSVVDNFSANYFFNQAYKITDWNSYYSFLSGSKLDIDFSLEDKYISKQKKILQNQYQNQYQNQKAIDKEKNIFKKLLNMLFKENMEHWVYTLCVENFYLLDIDENLKILKRFTNKNYKINYAAFLQNNITINFNKEFLTYLYPRYFYDYVKENALNYKIDKNLIFSIIRSESFFNTDVKSSAGAVGLTQLMESTAKDVSKKLRINDYDLKDPKINITFGTFYYAEMLRRLHGDYLSACFAYNAGITRVRNWKANYSSFPMDLFLEVLPYGETREYGRKIINSFCVYSYIYENIDPKDSLQLFFVK